MSQSLLHHEQGHVNIQNILKIEANRVLKSQTYSVKNYKNEIATLANSISAFYNTMQNNYDIETEHGANHKMQARWDKIIEEKTLEVSNL
jgi:predicted secreted Zn-dependent protease